jgi:L-2-hydroxyglutarate oxidase
MTQQNFDLIVVGGGLVGLATAYKYQLKHPDRTVAILEKEDRLAAHQSGHNSGVIHSGIYYKPGSLRAKNCINGRKQLVDFAKTYGIPHEVCGKLILATDASELDALEKIYQRGLENEIEGISLIGPDEIKEVEPFAEGLKAIKVPVSGIINYVRLCKVLVMQMRLINEKSQLFLNTKVLKATPEGVATDRGNFKAGKKLFCTGLQSDRMANQDKLKTGIQIVGFRGDYYELSNQGKHKVKHLIYPVPDPDFPFLGVHFTRMTDGSIECGPNAVFSFKREGYQRTSFNLKDTVQALSYAGTWKLFAKHWRKGLTEYKRAFSKGLFLKTLQRMIPDLSMDDIVPVRAGVRAIALQANGELLDDFKVVVKGNSVHVLNAPSPAATACLSIADYIIDLFD